jgi:hypothetical protein
MMRVTSRAENEPTLVERHLDDEGQLVRPTKEHATHVVRKGDTLGKLADTFQKQGVRGSRDEIVDEVLKLNPHIKNRDLIFVGDTLRLPSTRGERSAPSPMVCVEPFKGASTSPRSNVDESSVGETFSPGELEAAAAALPTAGRAFPKSEDGTPLMAQGDPRWGGLRIGTGDDGKTIAQKGCMLTALAMAMSKQLGRTVTPAELDQHLKNQNAYSGANLHSQVAGSLGGANVEVQRHFQFDALKIDQALAEGRPVLIGVDYRRGQSCGTSGTDHWLCLTRRDEATGTYYANNPGTGQEVALERRDDGSFSERQSASAAAKRRPYRSTQDMVTFDERQPTTSPSALESKRS